MNTSNPASGNSSTIGEVCVEDGSIKKKILPVLYSLMFIASILMNSAAAWILSRQQSGANLIIYLKNIVAADLLTAVTLPVEVLTNVFSDNVHLAGIRCRFSAVIFYSSTYIGILFFGAISLDRYIKIVKPTRARFVKRRSFAIVASFAIWLSQLFISLPNTILTLYSPLENKTIRCTMMKSELGKQWHRYSVSTCMIIFWIVLVLLVISYFSISMKIYKSYQKLQQKIRRAQLRLYRNICCIVLVFCICFVPYHICRIPYLSSQFQTKSRRCRHGTLYLAKELTLVVATLNICMNPLIHFLLCKPFSVHDLCPKLGNKK
ncbi:P2Y purinoceptor 14-like [Protopterus annectens]|uniref:P2Y purinoceptor 14-like n=1 Tax=Protopterus annectens TaxID=7888 RepID=UPI001CFA7E65|nr:P2Y purinoceptor 14-like [Protopterus annectens]